MARMIKCRATGIRGKSEEFYKIGRDWFKDKNAYIDYLKNDNKHIRKYKNYLQKIRI